MGLIINPAIISWCDCHKHGCFVYGDGSKSEEFYHREQALAEVETALVAGKIVKAEAEYLREGIRKSSMLSEAQVTALKAVVGAFQELFGHGRLPEQEYFPEQDRNPPPEHRTLH